MRRCRDGQPRRAIGSAWVAGFVPREGRPCHSDSGDGDDDSDVCDDDDDDGGGDDDGGSDGGGDDDDGGCDDDGDAGDDNDDGDDDDEDDDDDGDVDDGHGDGDAASELPSGLRSLFSESGPGLGFGPKGLA